MYISIYPCRFYTSHSCSHLTIPDFSSMILRWNYTDKKDILKCFYFKSVKSSIQSRQTYFRFDCNWIYILWTKDKSWKKISIQISHFRKVVSLGRSYLRQNSLTASFKVTLCVNIHLFSVFHITAIIGYCMWLHVSGYHPDRCGL